MSSPQIYFRHVWVRVARHHGALARVLVAGDGKAFTGSVFLKVPRVWTKRRELYWCDVIGEATDEEVRLWTARVKRAA